MNVMIQISDATYASLLNGTKRIQGTLALVSPNEGNFHEHQRNWQAKPGIKFMKLPHGRISVSDEDVRMHLSIRRCEWVDISRTIREESTDASGFVEIMMEDLQ